MSFRNRARLAFYVTRPQFPEERNTFRLANGRTKVQSVIIRKVLEGETDYLPVELHERLKIALAHDNITIEGYRYLSGVGVVAEADYEIAWIAGMIDYPLAKAAFKVEVSPYNVTNDNCQSCEEATQLSLVDDTFPDPLEEDTEYTINVFANDDICCKPITAEIVEINSTFLESAEIDPATGIITVVTKTPLMDANGVNLLTYRVTCPNGSYDDADVFGNIEGSIDACLAPTDLDVSEIDDDSATATWAAPTPAPANGYIWQLYYAEPFLQLVDSGTTAGLSVNLTGLEAGREYTFFVQSDCGDGVSNNVTFDFTTSSSGDGCGRYEVSYDDGTGNPENFTFFEYMNCAGDNTPKKIQNLTSVIICALESSPGSPYNIVGATFYTYIEPC